MCVESSTCCRNQLSDADGQERDEEDRHILVGHGSEKLCMCVCGTVTAWSWLTTCCKAEGGDGNQKALSCQQPDFKVQLKGMLGERQARAHDHVSFHPESDGWLHTDLHPEFEQ